jgi:hypothetical protein
MVSYYLAPDNPESIIKQTDICISFFTCFGTAVPTQDTELLVLSRPVTILITFHGSGCLKCPNTEFTVTESMNVITFVMTPQAFWERRVIQSLVTEYHNRETRRHTSVPLTRELSVPVVRKP